MPEAFKLSVIIPVLNDAPALQRCLNALAADKVAAQVEIIVVDGGNDEACGKIARDAGAVYLVTERGRAAQMNAGALAARGTRLWFLHADCEAAAGSLSALTELPDAAAWGCFRHRIDAPSVLLRGIEFGDNLRARFLKMPYGDQGIFVRRDVFESAGRFPNVSLLEDVLLARGLARNGAPRVLRHVLKTDARRWLERGIFKTTLTNWKIMWLFLVAKKSPDELALIYRKK